MSVATDLPPEVVFHGRALNRRVSAFWRSAALSGEAPSVRTVVGARIGPTGREGATAMLGHRSPARAARPRLAVVPVRIAPMAAPTTPRRLASDEAGSWPKPVWAPGLANTPITSVNLSTGVASGATPQRSLAQIGHPTTPVSVAHHLTHHPAQHPADDPSHRAAHHVSPLHARSVASPSAVQLTHRGRVVLVMGAALLAFAVVAGSWLSQRGDPQAESVSAPSLIVVRTGDTLWAIARRVAPQRDPRAEVSDLVRVNHLSVVDLAPGQLLRTR